MGRPIKDSIVHQRCKEIGFDTSYIDNLPLYFGSVKEDLDKVRLEKSKYGLEKEPIIKAFKDKYDTLHIKDKECCIKIDDAQSIQVTQERIRLLKALILEHISPNQEYSYIIFYIFQVLLTQCIHQKQIKFDKELDIDWMSSMQKCVYTAVSDFICKKISEEVQYGV